MGTVLPNLSNLHQKNILCYTLGGLEDRALLEFYFTPAAISYLTQLILAALISGYFLALIRRRPNPPHLYWLTASFLGLTGFIAALFLGAAMTPPAPTLTAVFLQAPLLAGSWVCMLQFAYHYPALPAARRWEARGVLYLSSLYGLWEVGYAVFRFVRLAAGVVEYRIDWTDALLLLLLLWTPVVFVRQLFWQTSPALTLSQRLRTLCRPPLTREQRALCSFTLIFLFVAGLSGFNLLRTYYVLPVAFVNAGIAVGILLVLAAFALTYLNQRPELTSFMVKLAGVTLTAMLAILGSVGWAISPATIAAYQPEWPAGRALRFTPNAGGGYEATAIPFAFDAALGRDLALDDGLERGCSEAVPFAFPFYGQDVHEVYVCNDGVIAVGQPVRYREFQYRYGAGVPLLLPLLLDLDPTISPGGVFARQADDRLVVTWDRLRAFRQPEAEFTFQAVLYADGRFDFVYAALSEVGYQPNDDPGASLWAVGAIPGNRRGPAPQQVTLTTLPIAGGPAGIVQDFRLDFSRRLNGLLAPLAGLILAASGCIVAGLPWLLHALLVRPLNALLRGVQQMENGEYAVAVPVQFFDEIGFLTRAFNTLAAELGDWIRHLEARVAARTAELDTTNTQLRAEIQERAQAQSLLIEQQRALARFEEREQLGRELHDGLGQMLGYINVQAQAAQTFLDEGRSAPAHSALSDVIQAAQDAHTDVRAHILGLRAQETPPQDFFTTVEEYLRQFGQRYHVATRLSAPSPFPKAVFAPAVEEQVAHILQEGLTNACKHGQAHTIEVTFNFVGDQAQLIISDDGVGFEMSQCVNGSADRRIGESADRRVSGSASQRIGESADQRVSGSASQRIGESADPRMSEAARQPASSEPSTSSLRLPASSLEYRATRNPQPAIRNPQPGTCNPQPATRTQPHFGLQIMRERAEQIGGALEIRSAPGAGTRLFVTFPRFLPTLTEAADADLHRMRILLADDHPLFLSGLHTLLVARGLTIIGLAHDGEEVLEKARVLLPDVVVMDLKMPKLNGLEALRVLKAEFPNLKVVILTAAEDEAALFEAIKAGASGYLLKSLNANQFCALLAGLLRDEAPLSPGLAARVLEEFGRLANAAAASSEWEALSVQQRAILSLAAQGLTYKEIAVRLYLAEKTIKYHMAQILERLHLENRAQAIAYYRQRHPDDT